MKKSELLKLKPGVYLLTDEICNYKYFLYKSKKDNSHVGAIYSYHTFTSVFSDSINIHYDLIESFEDDYNEYNPLAKRLRFNASIGGLTVRSKEYYNILDKLNLIGIYDKESALKDLKKFSLNHKINMDRYDKNRFKRPKY